MNNNLDVFDMETFNEVRIIMKDKLKYLVEEYLENTQSYIDGIKQGFVTNDSKIVMYNAHTLKSSSESLGAISVSVIATEIEAIALKSMEYDTQMTCIQEYIASMDEAFSHAKNKMQTIV